MKVPFEILHQAEIRNVVGDGVTIEVRERGAPWRGLRRASRVATVRLYLLKNVTAFTLLRWLLTHPHRACTYVAPYRYMHA